MPGPASTEGERPPTNPAIRVQFPPEADGIFFRAMAEKCVTPIYRITPSRNESAIYWKNRKVVFNSLSV